MATWYVATFGEIEPVEILKHSEKFVTLVNGRRSAISTDQAWYRPEREQAKAAMVAQYESERDQQRLRLLHAEQKLADAQNA